MRRIGICLLAAALTAGTRTAGAELLTLQSALDQAAKTNGTLKVAAYDEKSAAESVTIARSGYLPRVDFQGGYTAQKEPQSIKFTAGWFPTQEADYPFFTLALTQTLYDFGRTQARSKRAVLMREAAGLNYSGTKQTIFLQVVQTYFGILESMKNLQTAADEVQQRKEHLRVARNLYEQGVVTRNDLLQAEVKLADSTQRELDAANRVENAWLELNFIMGQPPHFRAQLDDSPDFVPVPPEEATPERALTDRPDMAVLRKSREASEADVAEAKSAFFPELYARLGVDYVENKMVNEQAIYAATVGVRVNLFEGFAAVAAERQAVQNRSRAEEILRLEESRIRLELQTAQNDEKVAAARIATIQESIRQGEENLRINRDRYSEQVGTATEVLDAQTLLTQVKNEYNRAVYAHQVAQARVRHALGRL